MDKVEILIIEDETDIREVIEHNLSKEGFSVRSTGDGGEALGLIKSQSPDLVLLDLMLPGMNGLEICRRIKTDPVTSSTAVIMVTAKGEESDIVLGLGLGADDYISKPFSPREMIARVNAVVRRIRGKAGLKERITYKGMVIDSGKHGLWVDGQRVEMTATEFRLIHFLAAHPGRVFTRERLLSTVFGEDAFITDRNIDVHITAIRKKLGPYKHVIETVRGVGYRFSEKE